MDQTGVGDIYRDFYAAQQAQNVTQQPQYPWSQASYPDNFHVGYDPSGRPIYRDRWARFHYGQASNYAPAPPPPVAPAWGLGDAPTAPPPADATAAAPAAAPAASAPAAVVVSTPPGGTTAVIPTTPQPFYQRAAHALSLPHPAGAALVTALGAGVGGIAGQHLLPRLGLRQLSGSAALAAGAAIGAGIAGGVAAMLMASKAHQQHSDQTGAPVPA